jgi:hypothetical protein
MRIKVEYNPTTDQPELEFSYNADATALEEKVFERFIELLATTGKKATASTSTLQGVKTTTLKIESE